jgi:hypothetical protein
MNEFNYFPQLTNQAFHHQQQQYQYGGEQQARNFRRGYYN